VEVVAFTATADPVHQRPKYPAELSGSRYPDGIRSTTKASWIASLPELRVDEVVFAYSDVSHVSSCIRRPGHGGGSFLWFPRPDATMLGGAGAGGGRVRGANGVGQEPDHPEGRADASGRGRPRSSFRHPMPYGDLVGAARGSGSRRSDDLDRANVTIEEREE